MKIVEETPERLVLDSRPWVFGALMAGMIVFSLALLMLAWRDRDLVLGIAMLFTGGCGIAAFLQVNRRLRLTLDKTAATATLTIRDRKGLRETRFPLDKVRISTQSLRSKQSVTRRPVLLVDTASPPERHVLHPTYVSGPAPEKIVHQVRLFLGQNT